MYNNITLNNLKVGQKAVIKEIIDNSDIKRRYLDLGIVNGTVIECVQESPLGNPMAYKIRGTIIAIRREDSEKIVIEVKNK